MSIRYEVVDKYPGWRAAAPQFLESLINQYGCKRILEIGSGANPTLVPKFIILRELSYFTSDLDPHELAKTDAAFEPLILDIAQPGLDPALHGSFDCVFSRNVSEHIKEGEQAHRNIFTALRPGGISVHCFSTLWALPFTVNRLLPNSLGSILYNLISPRSSHNDGKFKAYYSWSRGPMPSMIRRFEKVGFEIIQYTGYFGHNYYYKLPWLDALEKKKARFLVQHPVPLLCSYGVIILRKPDDAVRDEIAMSARG